MAASIFALSQIERTGSGGPSLILDAVVGVGAALSGWRLGVGSLIAGAGLTAWLFVTWEPPALGAAAVLIVLMVSVAKGRAGSAWWLTCWYFPVIVITITRWTGESLTATLFNVGFLLVVLGLVWMVGWIAHRREVEVDEATSRFQADLEKQRFQLARDLHDTLAQNVTGMVLAAEAVRARLGGNCPDEVLRDIERSLMLGRQSVADLRVMMRFLRNTREAHAVASSWTPLPVMQALSHQAACLQDHGFTVAMIVEGNPDALPPSLRHCLSKVIVEATNNIIKHAMPTERCSIMIDMTSAGAEAVFTNACHPEAMNGGDGGLGLIGAAERVRLVGGDLTARRCGTQWILSASLPASGCSEDQYGRC